MTDETKQWVEEIKEDARHHKIKIVLTLPAYIVEWVDKNLLEKETRNQAINTILKDDYDFWKKQMEKVKEKSR